MFVFRRLRRGGDMMHNRRSTVLYSGVTSPGKRGWMSASAGRRFSDGISLTSGPVPRVLSTCSS